MLISRTTDSQLQPVRNRRLFLASALIGLLLASGCGGAAEGLQRAAVAGSVDLDGQPLTSGNIVFIPTSSTIGPSAIARIVDGRFKLSQKEGPVIGQHRVEIDSVLAMARGPEVVQRVQQGAISTPGQLVPVQYNRQSTLTQKVESTGSTQLEFHLRTEVPTQ